MDNQVAHTQNTMAPPTDTSLAAGSLAIYDTSGQCGDTHMSRPEAIDEVLLVSQQLLAVEEVLNTAPLSDIEPAGDRLSVRNRRNERNMVLPMLSELLHSVRLQINDTSTGYLHLHLSRYFLQAIARPALA